MGAPSIDHVAVQVPDFDRCLDFFTSVLGMEVTLVDPASGEKPWKQAWVGGIQLQRMDGADASGAGGTNATDAGAGPAPSMTHIGIAADNAQELLDKAYALEGIRQAPGKDRNWFVLPNGITIELLARE